jgi:glutathione peroxidase
MFNFFSSSQNVNQENLKSLHDFKAELINGDTLDFSVFKGKKVMIVNTASACGLTPQYKGLESIYQEYKDLGFEIIAFPANNFANQESGSNEEIQSFCNLNYGVTFPLSEKIEVNGSNAHPVYQYLKSELKGKLNDSIKWNFTKFLIHRDGTPYKRFSATVEPQDIKPYISELL